MGLVLGAIFVGGAATRFGGIAKGLLPAPDGSASIVLRTIALMRQHDVAPLLVGQREEYKHLDVPVITDPGTGPVAALQALYAHARERRVLVVACDMPFVRSIASLLAASPQAPLVAPRRAGRWEPFFSRHDAAVLGPLLAGHRRLQDFFDAVPAVAVDIDAHELDDWDSPADRTS